MSSGGDERSYGSGPSPRAGGMRTDGGSGMPSMGPPPSYSVPGAPMPTAASGPPGSASMPPYQQPGHSYGGPPGEKMQRQHENVASVGEELARCRANAKRKLMAFTRFCSLCLQALVALVVRATIRRLMAALHRRVVTEARRHLPSMVAHHRQGTICRLESSLCAPARYCVLRN